MAKNKFPIYLISVLLFMFILPVVSISVELFLHKSLLSWLLIGKWFVFWSIGVRLFIAGIRQALKPEFTAKEIFHIRGEESFVVIKELGFANLSIGLMGMLSLLKTEWCSVVAIGGGLFFGLAGILHVLKKPDSNNEIIAMISDLFIFAVALCYLFFSV